MGPDQPIPYSNAFTSTQSYVESLIDIVGKDDLLRTLCGGVHIMDFFTCEPDLYSRVLPQEWRDFFLEHDNMDLLDLFLRDDLALISPNAEEHWHNGPLPPHSLLSYIRTVRDHLLIRDVASTQCQRNRTVNLAHKLARHVAVGMTIKKTHEVGLFASYLNTLVDIVSQEGNSQITHLVDFGSGQNYLGRALASEPYNRRIIAIESKSHNAERAKEFDVMAKLVTKQKVMRNKKAFRAGLENQQLPANLPTPPPEQTVSDSGKDFQELASLDPTVEASPNAHGRVQYIEHRIRDGDLSDVLQHIDHPSPRLMVMSLHSCGNLVHHGLRSLIINPAVQAVAMVGCCYNLVTERLGPPTYKLPELRPTTHKHPRLEGTRQANDPHGFPMSERFCSYVSPATAAEAGNAANSTRGIRLNITARMMAVQAPQNWGRADSESFFTRHFYRALLQRILLDRGIVGPPRADCVGGVSPAGHSSGGTPIVIGSLSKACYTDFVSYVRGAMAKLEQDPDLERAESFKRGLQGLTDEEIEGYAAQYGPRKKDLSVIWSLMAFSAGVVEAAIVVDRWLWLKEQPEVAHAWVEPVFDYRVSPRNLVVVGIKKGTGT